MNIIGQYKSYCCRKGIGFQLDDKVNPYDDTTLFCPAGMQQFKGQFKDQEHRGTRANVQSCIRMNDFSEIGDATHLLYFNMIGLFSFREMSVQQAVDFWMEFLGELGLKLGHVTIHPDKPEWEGLYSGYGVKVIESDDCKWTDGDIGGYCTEFFIDDVEIGNIVNPNGDCIDVGFGLERMGMFLGGEPASKERTLKETALKIISSGYRPSNLKQGYVLRKILREIWKTGASIDHPFFQEEVERQGKISERYQRLKVKHAHMPREWWYDTHGIDLDDVE
jgi:alanyl-tRNA synthetase